MCDRPGPFPKPALKAAVGPGRGAPVPLDQGVTAPRLSPSPWHTSSHALRIKQIMIGFSIIVDMIVSRSEDVLGGFFLFALFGFGVCFVFVLIWADRKRPLP